MSFDPIPYNETFALRKHFVLLNGSPEAIMFLLDPTVTPASFAAWLAAGEHRALFEQLIAAPAGVSAVAANATAMAAVIASSTAMAAVIASSTAMAAVAASSTAMAAVIASSTAMAAVAASSTAMAAVAASSTAMAAVIASSTAMAAVKNSPTALSAINNSETAKNAAYNSPIRTRVVKSGTGWQQSNVFHNGTGIFVRLNHGNNFPGSSGVRIDGVYPGGSLAQKDSFLLTKYSSSLAADWYNDQSEMVYIVC